MISQILFSEFFVIKCKMGIKGAGLSMGLAQSIIFVGLNIYPLIAETPKGIISWPTKESCQNLGQYLQKGIPLSLMLCFEWMAFECLILMSGAIGVAEQAAQTIIMNTLILFFGFIVGIQTAVASLVGRQIGRQNIEKAKDYYHVAKLIARVQVLGTAVLFYSLN